MRFGVRSKLFAVSFALIVSVGLASGLYLQAELRAGLETRIENELSRQAMATRSMLDERAGARTGARTGDRTGDRTGHALDAADSLAHRLAQAFDSRITLIDGDSGRVLDDSDVAAAAVPAMENHGDRPEVLAALAHGRGQSHRHSTTLGTDMLYVAVAYERAGQRGVVRVARPLSDVDAAVARLRAVLLFAGAIGLVVAVLMSALSSHLMSRTLRQLAKNAHAMANRKPETAGAADQPRPRLDEGRTDELGGLAGSINRMARAIEATIDTLARERARFKAVLDGMSEPVIAIDEKRRIQLMNSAARALFGLDSTPRDELLLAYLRAPAMDELLALPLESRSREFDLPSHRERRMLAHVTPERAGSGCIIVMHDVTDLRRLMTVRRDFVANVSHELRTPISVILANAETLLDGASDDPVHGPRLLEALHRNARRMSDIITDLLVLSRIESGHEGVEPEPVNIAEAARRAVQSLEHAAREREIEIEVELEVSDELCASADRGALDHILVNYLDNAIKYTQRGGHVTVRARATTDRVIDDRVRIEVIDNGPGIAQHLHARVFERFFRVAAGRSQDDTRGTGLGLAIVKHLAGAMHGDVGVDSVSPHGACFHVSLPVAPAIT